MNIVVTSQHRYLRTPDGAVWTDGKYPYSFWTRYLAVFQRVRVVARAQPVAAAPPGAQPVTGAGVDVWPLPFVRGAHQWLTRLPAIRRAARAAVGPRDAVMLRVPGEVACCLDTWLWRERRPYGVECVGDPRELFAPGAVRSIFRPWLLWFYPPRLRRECAGAVCAAYVTEHALQRSYPPAPGAFTTHYSSIELDDDAFAAAPRCYAPDQRRFTLVFVGTLEQFYKGPDVAIDATAECARSGLDVHLRIVGDGKHRAELEQRAHRAGVGDRVTFVGQVHGAPAVRAELDRGDLFISPSRQEGLPRAMIEALARALPSLGTTVGGTAELVAGEYLVPPGEVAPLAQTLRRVLGRPDELERMSRVNLEKARQYHQDVLAQRRAAMYAHLCTKTQTAFTS
ncbi:MAG: glycosyltransferase family 4 protein [Phycisphaerae bacterium]